VGLSETTQTILHTAEHGGPPIINPPWLLIVLLQGVVFVSAGGWFVFFASTRPAGTPFWYQIRLPGQGTVHAQQQPPSDTKQDPWQIPVPLPADHTGPPPPLESTLATLAAYGHQQRKERSMGNDDDDDGFWGPETYQPARSLSTNTIEQSSFPER
jgi:hypothetical protein